MNKEDQLLLAGIEDKILQCAQQYRMTGTSFLDMRQRAVAEQFCRARKEIQWKFYGGYPDAERAVLLFFPDYMEVQEDVCSYFAERPEEDPLRLLRICHSGKNLLTHRDYLGSLLGLGLKREVSGDILVREKGCDLIVTEDIAEFILFHYTKAGSTSLTIEEQPMSRLLIPEGHCERVRDTVASLRIDCIAASAFSLSRSKASEAVQRGLVSVNGLQAAKPDMELNRGDKLVLRGKGKVILKEIGPLTRKDRVTVYLDRYR